MRFEAVPHTNQNATRKEQFIQLKEFWENIVTDFETPQRIDKSDLICQINCESHFYIEIKYFKQITKKRKCFVFQSKHQEQHIQ